MPREEKLNLIMYMHRLKLMPHPVPSKADPKRLHPEKGFSCRQWRWRSR